MKQCCGNTSKNDTELVFPSWVQCWVCSNEGNSGSPIRQSKPSSALALLHEALISFWKLELFFTKPTFLHAGASHHLSMGSKWMRSGEGTMLPAPRSR